MPTSTFDLFCKATAEKKQVVCTYNGYVRKVCPHAVGYKLNREQAMTFQFAGGSSKGLPPGGEWRCLELSKVTGATIQDGPWHTDNNHSRPQTCVDHVVVEVDH